MNAIVLDGIVTADGELELREKIALPAGRVQVTVESVAESGAAREFVTLMEGIWAERARAGLAPRSEDEVRANRQRLNDEMDEEVGFAARLQAEARRAREDLSVEGTRP